ncbi:MAG: hypothetical protein IKK97_00705 [Phascolarctobacterium sp.]|nr:hypothetical protein [Phascolarctobacterium sp.]
MRRAEVTNAILTTLQANVPAVPWSAKVFGAATSNKVEGTIACDRVEYQYDSKNSLVATATYYVYIVDVNSTNDVDGLADAVFQCLNNDDLAGVLIVGDIVRISYGVAPGKANSSAVLMEYVVQYYED